ncbi:XrtA/PEP-CTERM system exopolysaccharide export protein [Amphritea sp. HPY]|uniref:XrtA/PEP-CTERM system exopolysaccharide export protein n=1 Tax=Amphritea sp. HPY TaxID=3421652 RepID=UPI003D7DCB07
MTTWKTVAAPFLACLTMIISGCATQNPVSATPPPQPSQEQVIADYVLGNGDKLDIRVWRNPELSVSLPVRPDGKISIPLAGEVTAAGKSTAELTETLVEKLSVFIKQPQVTVIVTDPQSAEFLQRVRITGAISNPTSTPWRSGMTVLDLVLLSGGTTEFASENKAFLYRKVGNSVQTYPVYLEDILRKGQLDTNYSLIPSDIITVPERLF